MRNLSPSSTSARAATLDIDDPDTRSEVDTVGIVRFNSRLLDCLLFPTREPFPIEVRTALIVVARIGFLRPIRDGAQRLPFVATVLLANGFGRVLAVFDSGFQDGAALPPGVGDYGGKRTSAAEIRKFIFEHPSNNNVLVGVHLARTLTALSLSIPASRAVDLGSETVFQELLSHGR